MQFSVLRPRTHSEKNTAHVFSVYVIMRRYVVQNVDTHATEYTHRDTGEFRATCKRLVSYEV